MRGQTVLLLLAVAWRAASAELIVRADLECRLLVNGEPRGLVKVEESVRLNVEPGSYVLEASAVRPGPALVWRQTVEVKAGETATTAQIGLRGLHAARQVEARGYWTDPATGLDWAGADNASAISWSQAHHYCESLLLGGRRGWRLPAIEELQGIYGGTANARGFRIVSPLKLTGWIWSATPGREPGGSWALDFGDGARASVVAGDAGPNRALCVHAGSNSP